MLLEKCTLCLVLLRLALGVVEFLWCGHRLWYRLMLILFEDDEGRSVLYYGIRKLTALR